MKNILVLLLVASSVYGQKQVDPNQFYPVDKGHSFIEFSIQYMGYAKVKGRFADFSGLLYYDEKDLTTTSATIDIKTESLDTDLEFRDTDLKSENWLDVKKYPSIRFVSKSVKPTANGFEMKGDITIKGVTKEIVLVMNPSSGILKDVQQDLQVIFSGTTSLDRTAFGVEGKNWSALKEGITAVSNTVSIELSILGKRLQVGNFANWVRNEQRPAGKIYKVAKEQGVKQALETFKSLKESGSVEKVALSTVGYMLRLEGKLQDALALYEANRDAFPEAAEVYTDLGEVYSLLGEKTKAKASFEEALKKDPNNLDALEVLRHF